MPVLNEDLVAENSAALTFAAADITWIISLGVSVFSENSTGIYMPYNMNWLINNGETVSGSGRAVESIGAASSVFNAESGLIAGLYGVEMVGVHSFLNNNGTISGLSDVYSGIGVYMRGDFADILNVGTISGDRSVVLDSIFNEARIRNAGIISGDDIGIDAVKMLATDANGVLTISNDGTIGGDWSISSQYQTRLTNSGLLSGAVSLGDSADYFRNAGTVIGQTELGAGDDQFDGRGGSSEGWLVNGGAGEDSLIGGASEDSFNGGDDKDILRGLAGDDLLQGGRGADSLLGGRGGDMFLYSATTESGIDAATRDTIRDFSTAEGDLIDLGLIDAMTGRNGNQAFKFIGASEFTGRAGELRYELVAGGGVLVVGNTDTDLDAEFSLLLKGASSLSSGDFVL